MKNGIFMRNINRLRGAGICLILVVCAAGLAGGCGKKESLPAPQNLLSEGFGLRWDAVEHAEGYAVAITNSPHKTVTESELSLGYLEAGRRYRIRVKALGSKGYADSAYSEEFVYELDENGKVRPRVANVRRTEDTPLYFEDGLPELTATASARGALRLDAEQYLSVGTYDYHWTFEPEDAEHCLTVKGTVSLTTEPAKPVLEDEVKVAAVAEDTLQVFSPLGKQFEYSLDKAEWQSDPVFSGLVRKKDYRVYARLKGTDDFLPSSSTDAAARTYGYDEILQSEGGKVTGLKEVGQSFSVLNIPAEIDGVAVTEIGAKAFYGNARLTAVSIPDSVTAIGSEAFVGCRNLASVRIPFAGDRAQGGKATHFGYLFGAPSAFGNRDRVPASLTEVIVSGAEIGARAFYGCNRIESVSLTDSVQAVGDFAFEQCAALQSVDLNRAVRLNGSVFAACDSLAQISVAEDNAVYAAEGLTVLTKGAARTLVYGAKLSAVPADVVVIGAYAFYKNEKITEITAPGLTAVEAYAFYCCEALRSVEADALLSVGDYAFEGCESLRRVAVPSAVSVGERAFFGDSALTEADISAAQSIGGYAFYGCSALASADMRCAERIGDYAFYGCGALAAADLKNAEEIGVYAFYRCRGLRLVDLSRAEQIGMYAFRQCSALERGVFAAGAQIGERAFADCANLREFFYTGTGETEWNGAGGIRADAGNDALSDGVWRYFAGTRPAADPDRYWHYDENGVPAVWNQA